MRQRVKLMAYFAIFWVVYMIAVRALFLIYNHDLSQQLSTPDLIRVFLNGLKMDISITGYVMLLTGLVLTVSIFTQSKWIHFTLQAVTIFFLLFSSLVVIVDLELYRHWGFRLNTAPLFYVAGAESEAMGSVAVVVVIQLVLILAAVFAIFLFIYYRWLVKQTALLAPAQKKSAIALFIITALMILPIRGSFTVAPMNAGFVYFHKTKPFANHAAINVVWNFLYSLQRFEIVYPKNFFDPARSQQYFESLYPPDDSTVHVFTTQRPNIILFILESYTAGVVEPLGGLKGVAPNLNQLCSEGVLFTNFFSSGDRTDKGIISILCGYPAQPQTSIIKNPGKTQKLPFLARNIRAMGYNTSFVYGGDIDFANIRSVITHSQFDHITTYEDFDDDSTESKWGFHDHIVFERAFQQCDTMKSPFFKVILSLSSHEPFDVPHASNFKKGNDQESLFLNACHYTDKAIGRFVSKAKKADWWKNTVIIFVADHGHRHPHNRSLEDKERFRIPLLMIGGAIKKDTLVHTFASQTDLANTLLAQLDKPSGEFRFSKNVLSPQARSFAAYFFNDGYGFVGPGQYMVYDNTGKQFLHADGVFKDMDISKAYQQILYLDYNSK